MKKKSNGQCVHVNFVLDETGSMRSCKDATISGFNEYVDTLKKKKMKFTLTKFDSDRIEVVHKAIPIKNVKHLTSESYTPGAMTPLYDAIGNTIKALDGAKKVLCVVMTDGLENASKEYTRAGICTLIKEKERAGWTFVYLGANQDAWAVGQSIGLSKGNVMNYDSLKKTKAAFKGVGGATLAYCNSGGTQSSSLLADNIDKNSLSDTHSLDKDES